MNKYLTSEKSPSEGTPVVGYSPEWIDEDFNPKGLRECWINGEGEWVSAYWLDEQDTYTNGTGTPIYWYDVESEFAKPKAEIQLSQSKDRITIVVEGQNPLTFKQELQRTFEKISLDFQNHECDLFVEDLMDRIDIHEI